MTIIPTKFTKTDAGRSESRRPKQKNDCSVRALSLAAGIAYDEAYDFLSGLGRKCNGGFHLQRLLDRHAKSGEPLFGHRIIKHSFPAQKGQSRMCIGTFIMKYPEGRFITRQARHVGAVLDGYVHDLFWDAFRCVYTAFELQTETDAQSEEIL